jgi:hypothetical protein
MAISDEQKKTLPLAFPNEFYSRVERQKFASTRGLFLKFAVGVRARSISLSEARGGRTAPATPSLAAPVP